MPLNNSNATKKLSLLFRNFVDSIYLGSDIMQTTAKAGASGRESCCTFDRLNEINQSIFLDDPFTRLLRNERTHL